MISRRLVRIKALQSLYAAQQGGDSAKTQCRQGLQTSLLATYDVYVFLLELPHYLNEYLLSEREIEIKKFYPDKEKIRRLGLLNNNSLAKSIYDKTLNHKRRHFTANWSEYGESFPAITDWLFQQEFTTDYCIFDTPDSGQQLAFLQEFYRYLLGECEPFYFLMQEVYGAWDDDENTLERELEKTLSSQPEHIALGTPYAKDDDEVKMALLLFDLVMANSEKYEEYISSVTENWDPGRIAIIDLLCLKLALAEFTSFPHIPLKVTINEYLDVVREYSTPNSGRFLNGVLDKLRVSLVDSGVIVKSGRGLRDK
ncbi:MAG: transcription antitermination protein NusB [Sphingomonadales bacterium]|jgi:N utilization substance protein B